MKDRVPVYPGRVKLVPVSGQENIYDMTRADQPTQDGDPLNKATLLKDATAALYGLGADAVPDDVLAYVGKYNLHWWAKYSKSYIVEESSSSLHNYQLVTGSSNSSSIEVEYGESIKADSDGNIVINNPSKISASYSGYSNFNVVQGKYFKDPNNGKVYRYSGLSDVSRGDYDRDYYYISIPAVAECNTKVSWVNPEFVQSLSRSEYPDNGEKNGYFYIYIGKLLDSIPNAPRVASGSYIGTGKSGSEANATSISFDFVPKFIWIVSRKTTVSGNYSAYTGLFNVSEKEFYTTSFLTLYKLNVVSNWTTVSWYSGDVIKQLNVSEEEYVYFAVG